NIYLNGAILGMSKKEIDSKLDAIIDFSGVERFIDQPVKNYSSGMYVRLGFSVSIHVEPDILLVDEVLAVGDMEFQNKCMDKFAQLKDQGRTVVVVSHGLEQMRTFCDQAAWLDHGTLVDVGNAAEVIDTYSDVAHHAVEVEGGGTRFGSGEAMIEKIELLGPSGEPTSLVNTGDAVSLRLHYRAKERITAPVFGVSIDTREGIFVWGLHGVDACYVPTSIEPGTGHLDVNIPRLALNPGSYTVSAAIQNHDMTSVIDALQKARRFDVLPGPGMESGGIITLGASFSGLSPERPMRDIARRGAADFQRLARMQAQQADALGAED
ncbi:MAG: Wzt carbohydrate-binding domain-containing protein, partial [Pauljensenia sp.]|nr:Wzt carbohydrate-binding domain-containing protein [Pauljensenia sp.]